MKKEKDIFFLEWSSEIDEKISVIDDFVASCVTCTFPWLILDGDTSEHLSELN